MNSVGLFAFCNAIGFSKTLAQQYETVNINHCAAIACISKCFMLQVVKSLSLWMSGGNMESDSDTDSN